MLDTIEIRTSEEKAQKIYKKTLEASRKVNWKIEDIIGGDKQLDFGKRFMPESLARVDELEFLTDDERKVLNQIKGHTYLSIFGLVEEFILPFVLDHVRPSLDENDYRVRAMLQFASEEAKHIQLFKEFSDEFQAKFGTDCAVIGPPSAVAEKVLSHAPLGIALVILHIEWMTQRHFIESIRDNGDIDEQFKSLLKNHWLEEAQHAKLDELMVEAIADGMTVEEIENGVNEYLEIGGFLDEGLKQQTIFELEAFEKATGRTLTEEEKERFMENQHQSNRWTYLGTGMTHPNFLKMVGALSSEQRSRLEGVGPVFS